MVKILLPKQMIGTRKDSWVLLECYVEAYPEPFVEWIFGESKVLLEGAKYNQSEEILDTRLSHTISKRIMLNISNVNANDFGLYKCLAKNNRGRTYGLITLYGIIMF